jgi:hypothetical protein
MLVLVLMALLNGRTVFRQDVRLRARQALRHVCWLFDELARCKNACATDGPAA